MNEWIIAWVNMVYDASESLAYTPLLLRINILFSKVKVIFKEKFYVPCSLSLWDLGSIHAWDFQLKWDMKYFEHRCAHWNMQQSDSISLFTFDASI